MSKKVGKKGKIITLGELVKVHVVEAPHSWGAADYRKWIDADPFMILADKPVDADVLVFTGGPDIYPDIYNQALHSATRTGSKARDRYEIAMYCMGLDKLKVGICRGAQLLNALSGGSMIQDVKGHTEPHDLILLQEKGKVMLNVPSTHHQMMVPSARVEDRVIIANALTKDRKRQFITPSKLKSVPDVMEHRKTEFFCHYRTVDYNPWIHDTEIVYYRSTNSLCVQSHPEKASSPAAFTAYINSLIVSLAKANKKRLSLKKA